ncbi:MAG: aminotransferase class V-fold PLP-dependent enzyme [Dorea sp.]|nr:aminotransferase class V-fold PLP-dependent enzyme [Dorea sp.]
MIYFDNAATTLKKPQEVIDAVIHAMTSLGNAGRGVNDASLDASRVIFDTRMKLAEFFHAESPTQIAFTHNATESLNIALKGLLNPGDHVITTEMEHNSVLRPLYELEKEGVELTILKCDKKGVINLDDLEPAIQSNTRMIVCTGGSNLTGNTNDLEAIGVIARKHALLFVVDASQIAGFLDIDVQKLGIDVLCFTGHKSLLGPQGTGGIYVRKGLVVRPHNSGGSGVQTYNKSHPKEMPTALEAGTLNGHGIAGLGAAIDYINKTGLDNIRNREIALMNRFLDGIRNVHGIKIYGDFESRIHCPIVSINLGDYGSNDVGDELYNTYHISTRAGGHCAPLMHQALGTVEQGAVRFSFSHYNTENEVDYAIKVLHELTEEE